MPELTKERGCGKVRKEGAAYLTLGLSQDGVPIERFLIDEPERINLAELGISPLGVHLIERNGVWHAFDIVGSEHYPNVADFIEEARRLGVSRRCELADYSKLTAQSRLILIHARAWIENTVDYEPAMKEGGRELRCPRDGKRWESARHMRNTHCLGYVYQDINPEDMDSPWRKLPCGAAYHAHARPDGVEPAYNCAIFAAFPVGRIEVVKDTKDNTHIEKVERARKSGLDVAEVEE